MAHQRDPGRIAAIVRDVLCGPGETGGTVFEEGGEFDLGHEAVVGDHDDISRRGKGARRELVEAAVAVGPGAAIDEIDHRPGTDRTGGVEVENLPPVGPVGEPAGDAARCPFLGAQQVEEGEEGIHRG